MHYINKPPIFSGITFISDYMFKMTINVVYWFFTEYMFATNVL